MSAPPHGFTPTEARQARRLGVVLAITCVFVALEITGAVMAESQVLLADGLHLLLDVVALALSITAMRLAVRPPTDRFTFGLRRVEPLAALANGLLVLSVAVVIVRESVADLEEPSTPRPTIMLIVAAAALVVHGLSAWLIHDAIAHVEPNAHGPHEHASHEGHHHPHAHGHAHAHWHAHGHALNLRGVWLHLMGDMLGAVTALVAAVVIRLGGPPRVDALGGLVVAVIVAAGAYRLLRDAILVLLDAAPAHLPASSVRAAIALEPGVASVDEIRVWTLGAGHDAVAVRLRSGDPGVAARIDARLRAMGVEFVTVDVRPPV